jgi:hypothetical protein
MKRVILTAFILLILPLVSASVSLSQPDALYNIGDTLNINATIYESSETSSFLTAKLSCGSNEIGLFKSPENLADRETKTIVIVAKLSKSFLGNIVGTCVINAEYADSKTQSLSFKISDKIEVSFLVNGIVSSPGDTFTIEGTATKQNRDLLEGTAEIYLRNGNITKTEPIKAGKFTSSMDLPESIAAGDYKLIVSVYEKDTKGNTLNKGETEQNITVRQVPSDIDIAINEVSLSPEDKLVYTILLYDQTGEKISQETAVAIIQPDKSTLTKEIIFSDKANNISFSSNAPPGIWQIESKLGNLSKTRTFAMKEYPKINYQLANTSLIIENTGNVIYAKPIIIEIGSIKEIKELTLNVGEKKVFDLSAPDGKYTIKLSTGQETNELGTSFLTGKAVAVKEPKEGSSLQLSFWIWIAIIIILFAVAFILYKRFAKRGYLQNLNFSQYKKPNYTLSSGEKNYSAVLSLHIKNMPELEENEPEAIEMIEKEINSLKESAIVRKEGEYNLFIFPARKDEETPTILAALTCGQEIKEHLLHFNKSAGTSISFGLGMHTGSTIVGKDSDNKTKFTAIGNALSIAKRISLHSKSALHISEQVHRIAAGKIKSEHLPDKNVWNVREIPQRGVYEKFIKGFLKRQKE